MAFRCTACKQIHETLPDVGFDRPDHAWHVPEAERAERVFLTEDHCIIDREDFFIRGVIELPLIDAEGSFGFGEILRNVRLTQQSRCCPVPKGQSAARRATSGVSDSTGDLL